MTDARALKRFTLVGIVVPAVVTLVALAAQLVWLPQTPDPLAVHWGTGGADGSGPRWLYPLLTVLLGFGLSVWLWAAALPRMRRGSRGWSFRFLAAMALGMSAFGAVALSWSVQIQVGLETWSDAPSVLPGVLVGTAIGILAGVAGWFAQPRHVAEFTEVPVAQLDLADGERAVWIGVATASRAVVATVVGALALVAAGAVVAWFAGAFSTMWILIGVVVLVGLFALTTLEADVRVDANGVDVRGPAGFPRSSTPLGQVASASAITVDGMGAFGGFGWRRIPGSMGVILRSGEALRVEREGKPTLVVTVDDAATAAALLTALKERA